MHRRTRRIIAIILAAAAAAAGITAVASVAAAPNNLAKTIEVQRRLTTERPNDAAVFNDLGNLLLLAQKPAEAEAAYRRALELDPDKVSALFNLGLLRQQRGGLKEAMQLYERAVKVDPDHAWAHYQLGAIHEVLHQPSRAIDEYSRAFALDPQLAFPEVNPHIVENKLVTEAMLRAYRSNVAAQPQAPKVYEDAGRIASLLVPPPAPPAAPEPGKELKPATSQTLKPVPTSAAARAGMNRPTTAQPGVKGSTVLRERDLDRTPSGQALPSGLARPSAPTGRQQPGAGGLRQWNRPEPVVQEVPAEEPDVQNDGGQPAPVITPPPGGVYYRPGLPSTGRLDLEVTPDSPPRQARAARLRPDR
ncbi:MAG TPA: tetratricopeptide repeat protein [Thermoanaerobaculia bacterium]|nr:tetratricopeptide repeat protein [Thermoanaerobaculia bacterium]